MNEEFLKAKSAKVNVPLEELKEKWNEFETNAKEFLQLEGDKLEEHIKYRIHKFYLKLEREPVIEGKFQPLAVDKTDYGVMRQFTTAIEAYNTDPESAVKDGLCTSQGVPIQQSGFNKGKPIDIATAFTVVYEGLFIQKDKNEKIHAKFRIGGKDVDDFPAFVLGNVYDVIGIKSQKQQPDGSILIIGRLEHKPKLFKEQEFDAIKEAIATYYQGKMIAIKDIPAYLQKAKENNDQYPVGVVRGNVYGLNVVQDKQEGDITIERNNRIEIMSENPETMEIHTIGGWVPKVPELDFKFSEDSQGVIIIGQLRERTDKNTNEKVCEFSKVSGIFVPKEFRKPEQSTVEKTEEVTNEDVQAFVNTPKQDSF